jgi:hypothetical protein
MAKRSQTQGYRGISARAYVLMRRELHIGTFNPCAQLDSRGMPSAHGRSKKGVSGPQKPSSDCFSLCLRKETINLAALSNTVWGNCSERLHSRSPGSSLALRSVSRLCSWFAIIDMREAVRPFCVSSGNCSDRGDKGDRGMSRLRR